MRHVIAPHQLADYEYYAQLRMALVTHFGGQHRGCVLLSKRATGPKIALTLFLFPSLANCGRSREAVLQDARCLSAFASAANALHRQ
ncbi:NIPSNAP family protein [Xanthomonas oryzae]|uniref:NIPSNAP family protein n=1 Tax=Xanthomonas oryzae TaxID=347 RepID=UPI00030BDE27|nr:NIPSNAP family protein [Xanthomonas oryzae]